LVIIWKRWNDVVALLMGTAMLAYLAYVLPGVDALTRSSGEWRPVFVAVGRSLKETPRPIVASGLVVAGEEDLERYVATASPESRAFTTASCGLLVPAGPAQARTSKGSA
jgi:hypothetical protein